MNGSASSEFNVDYQSMPVSSFFLVVPIKSLFSDASDSYSIVLRKTVFDHTDLIQLCLQHWDSLDYSQESQDQIQAIAADYAFTHSRNTDQSYAEAASTAYALRSVLESAYDFFQVWTQVAQLHFSYKELKGLRAKAFLSSTSILLELTT